MEMQKARQLILLAGRVEVVGYENPIILEEFYFTRRSQTICFLRRAVPAVGLPKPLDHRGVDPGIGRRR